MQCTRPVHVQNDQGFLAVPCGKCVMCKIAKMREWAMRCQHELAMHECAVFATLTYEDAHLPAGCAISKQELSAFLKRLRRDLEPRRIRYFACGEYGDPDNVSPLDQYAWLWKSRGFARPHYHAILFGVSLDEHKLQLVRRDTTDAGFKVLGGPVLDAWGKGFVVLGSVTFDSARYTARYMEKKFGREMTLDKYGYVEGPFQMQSQGLGKAYALANADWLRRDLGVTVKGHKVGLPKYYQTKVLTSDEDKARLYRKAQQAELDGRYFWAKKGEGNVYEQKRLVQRQRVQHEKNVVARLNKRGNLS